MDADVIDLRGWTRPTGLRRPARHITIGGDEQPMEMEMSLEAETEDLKEALRDAFARIAAHRAVTSVIMELLDRNGAVPREQFHAVLQGMIEVSTSDAQSDLGSIDELQRFAERVEPRR